MLKVYCSIQICIVAIEVSILVKGKSVFKYNNRLIGKKMHICSDKQ